MRDFWEGDETQFFGLVRGFWSCGERRREQAPVQAVSSAHQLIDQLGFQSSDDAMLRYVVSLTVDPASMHSGEVQLLREAGFSELEVHDIVMVVACFSYMNRLADGTGVTVLEGRHELARELLGEAALRTHLRWSQGT